MGLQDRDYMRRRTHLPSDSPTSRRTWVVVVVSVLAIASATTWLLRDVRPLIPDRAPREGSLVVNVNTATQAELETVPGIGPGLAALIMEGRHYQSVDELLRISGIGEQTLASMRPFLTTDGETHPR